MRSSLGHIQDGLEGDLSLSREVDLGHGGIAALDNGLKELVVFIITDICRSGNQ